MIFLLESIDVICYIASWNDINDNMAFTVYQDCPKHFFIFLKEDAAHSGPRGDQTGNLGGSSTKL